MKARSTKPAPASGKPRQNAAKSKPCDEMAPCFKYMNTPQTDDLARGNHVVPTEWAQQLERERDKAREEERLLKGILVVIKKDTQ